MATASDIDDETQQQQAPASPAITTEIAADAVVRSDAGDDVTRSSPLPVTPARAGAAATTSSSSTPRTPAPPQTPAAGPPQTPTLAAPQTPQTASPAKPPAPPKTRLMITKMQLQNFKSYAGKVEIGPFHQCFSAVVGPNGSGKSNVIDALLFVFGKRASKLRLKKVSELVHRSASFPNLDTATVSVFFHEIYDDDDDDTTNPPPQSPTAPNGFQESYRIVPGSSFTVTRTASKSNVSKYYVDDRASNFTLVTELLSRKGIDLDNNRFLILQGEVEQIAMMKSKAPEGSTDDGLLEYLEDIIGSNVYVAPTEAMWLEVESCNERRVEKVNRVKLVEREKVHLEGPRQEAIEFVRKEKELFTKTNILYQLYAHDAAATRAKCATRRDALQAQYDAEQARMEAHRVELMSVQTVYERAKSAHDAVATTRDAAKAEYAAFEKQDVKLREELKFAKEQLRELDATKKRELKKQATFQQKQQANDERVPELEAEVADLQVQLDAQEHVLETILDEHKTETSKLRAEMETLQLDIAPIQATKNALQSEIDTTATEIQLVKEPVAHATRALDANVVAIQDAEASIVAIEAQHATQEREIDEMQQRVVVAEQELADAKAQDAIVSEQFRDARAKAEDASGAVQSQATRSRMLRALLDASQPGEPLAHAGLCGRLGDLGAIDAKFDVAISTACGALDNLVVETTAGAQACVAYLRKHNLGRTTFLILEQLGYLEAKCAQSFRPITAPSGRTAPRLFDLVQVSDAKYRRSFYYALKDTLVANDLDEATAIAYQGSQCKYRVVTLDGQLVELSGAMSGGGKRTKSGGMSSSIAATSGMSEREIAALQQTAARLKDELQRVRDNKFALEKEVSTLTRRIEQSTQELPRLALSLKATKSKLVDLRANTLTLKAQTQLSGDAQQRVQALEAQRKAKQRECATVQRKVESMESKLAALKDRILDVGGAKLRKAQDVANSITSAIADKTKQMTKIRVDCKAAQKNSEKSVHALAQIEVDAAALRAQVELIKAQCTAMEEDAMAVLAKCEAIEVELTTQREALKKEEKTYAKLKKQVDALVSNEVDLQNSIDDCDKMLDESTKKEASWTQELTTLHATFARDQAQYAGMLDDDHAPRATATATTAQANAVGRADGDDVDMEDVEEQKDGDDDGDDVAMGNDDGEEASAAAAPALSSEASNVATLPMLDAKALARYNKEEIRYEISVLTVERDELRENVNMSALVEYKEKELECRARIQELEAATAERDAKRQTYDELRRKRLDEFMAGFGVITLKLKEMYQMITLGGDAELELVDSLDPFSEGVVFSVRPSKKSWKHISNLSGGEKTLASLALVFALHHYKPTPLYVMDEIDAALDFKNVSIVGNYIQQRTRNAQFVIISLRNNMFELADRLVGIYKTHDATKSVTINPKVYEAMLPTAAAAAATRVPTSASARKDDGRTPKKRRPSASSSLSLSSSLLLPSTPASAVRSGQSSTIRR